MNVLRVLGSLGYLNILLYDFNDRANNLETGA